MKSNGPFGPFLKGIKRQKREADFPSCGSFLNAPSFYKGKTVLIIGRIYPKDCGMLRIPHVLDSRLADGGEVVSLTNRPRSILGYILWYSFLLEPE
jgi:hypothetical protein